MIDAVFGRITEALKAGDEVRVTGFGTWSVRKVKARKAVNPRTRETVKVKAHNRPAFKAGKDLRQQVA